MVHGLIKDPSRWVDPISRANGLGSVAATRMAVPANSKMQLGLVSVFRSLSCRVDSIEPVPLIARLTFPAYANVPAHSNAGPMPGQCRANAGIQRVTVISGVVNMCLGNNLDTGNTHAFGPGSVAMLLPALNHFFWFSEETVIRCVELGRGWSLRSACRRSESDS